MSPLPPFVIFYCSLLYSICSLFFSTLFVLRLYPPLPHPSSSTSSSILYLIFHIPVLHLPYPILPLILTLPYSLSVYLTLPYLSSLCLTHSIHPPCFSCPASPYPAPPVCSSALPHSYNKIFTVFIFIFVLWVLVVLQVL